MQKITPFLWFDSQAEEAMNLYVSIFEDAKVLHVMRNEGKVLTCTFQLAGQTIMALNGGPHYQLTPAFSLFVRCETQAEIDDKWERLLAGGGKPDQCGWLRDRFGLSWQLIPTALERLLGDPDPAKAGRAMQAMLKMGKLDIAELERAHAGG